MKKKIPGKYTSDLGFSHVDMKHKIMNVLAICTILTAIIALIIITTGLI